MATTETSGAEYLAKPLMVFDGDCHFCRRWIARWNELTTDRVDYRPLQAAAADFQDIPRTEFEHEVKLIEPGGRVYGGAAAVFQVLATGNGAALFRFALWLYRHFTLFRVSTDVGYRTVAKNRMLASKATVWLWGKDVRLPTYFTARTWFLRGLGVIYFLAFLSLRVQVNGLIGERGILPAARFLDAARKQFGTTAFFDFPTLCWLTGASDGVLRGLCYAGMVLAALLVVDMAPALCLGGLWLCYLSLLTVGQVFLGFQWDILLLETGFLSLFIAPLRWLPGWMIRRGADVPAPLSRLGLFGLRWLLCRLMLLSGIVKLTSGDRSWWDFSTLWYHYESQPLPTWVGWYAHQFSHGFQKFSVGFLFLAELVAPLLIFGPRRVRLAGFFLLVLLQILIALTGNYGFFNLLTLALCVLLLDDLQWPRRLVLRPEVKPQTKRLPQRGYRWPVWLLAPVMAVYVFFGIALLWRACYPRRDWSLGSGAAYGLIEPFHSLNDYGLFRVMTRARHEIVIEGSNDGKDWRTYRFRYKPGDLDRAPAFVAPHQPRLDWQMWFAALDTYENTGWFTPLMARLLEGSPPVLELFESNPFPDRPPRYVRAMFYDYHFTNSDTRRRTKQWWQRELRGRYFPEVSLRNDEGP